jgi:hypothetical protein
MTDTELPTRLTGVLILALGFAALPFYHLWWFDLVTHALVAAVLARWVLAMTDRTALAMSATMLTLIIWEVFEFLFPELFVIGYRDTLADLVVGAVTVIGVLLFQRVFATRSPQNCE